MDTTTKIGIIENENFIPELRFEISGELFTKELKVVSEEDYQYPERTGFLLMIDACGIKNLRNESLRKTIAEINNTENLLNYLIDSNTNIPIANIEINPNVEWFFFQDTVIIGIEIFNKANASNYLERALNIFSHYINHSLFNGIFWRGAVTYGNYFKTENGFWGTSLNELAELYEKPRFFGVLAGNGLKELFNEDMTERCMPWLVEKPIPIKDKSNKTIISNETIFNWYLGLSHCTPFPEHISKDVRNNIEQYCYIIDLLRTDIDNKCELYENTKNVIKSCLENSIFNQIFKQPTVIKFEGIPENNKDNFIDMINKYENKSEFIIPMRSLNLKDYISIIVLDQINKNGIIFSKFDSNSRYNNLFREKHACQITETQFRSISINNQQLCAISEFRATINVIDNPIELGDTVTIIFPYIVEERKNQKFILPADDAIIVRVVKEKYKNGNSMLNQDIANEVMKLLKENIIYTPIIHLIFWSESIS